MTIPLNFAKCSVYEGSWTLLLCKCYMTRKNFLAAPANKSCRSISSNFIVLKASCHKRCRKQAPEHWRTHEQSLRAWTAKLSARGYLNRVGHAANLITHLVPSTTSAALEKLPVYPIRVAFLRCFLDIACLDSA